MNNAALSQFPASAPELARIQVSCTAIQSVNWLDWAGCGYTDVVAVFRCPLSNVPVDVAAFLSPTERSRAARFRLSADQQRFVGGRGLLRLLAGRYVRQQPAEVRIGTGPNGKPLLTDAPGLHINVAHSGDWLLLAFGRVPVGVDVETIQPDFAYADVAAQSFGLDEQQYVEMHGRRAFYTLWTRKESLVKATGQGMDAHFPAIPALDGDHWADARLIKGGRPVWSVRSFSLTDAYPAAVAFAGGSEQELRFYEISA